MIVIRAKTKTGYVRISTEKYREIVEDKDSKYYGYTYTELKGALKDDDEFVMNYAKRYNRLKSAGAFIAKARQAELLKEHGFMGYFNVEDTVTNREVAKLPLIHRTVKSQDVVHHVKGQSGERVVTSCGKRYKSFYHGVTNNFVACPKCDKALGSTSIQAMVNKSDEEKQANHLAARDEIGQNRILARMQDKEVDKKGINNLIVEALRAHGVKADTDGYKVRIEDPKTGYLVDVHTEVKGAMGGHNYHGGGYNDLQYHRDVMDHLA